MNEIINYFNTVNAEFIEETNLLQGEEVPKALHNFYQAIRSVDLPYGRIYDLDLALRTSKKAPFFPNWFVFGQDNYFCFWLCFKGTDSNGYYFTYWDHESGLEIEEPVWEDLLSFLKAVEEDINDEW